MTTPLIMWRLVAMPTGIAYLGDSNRGLLLLRTDTSRRWRLTMEDRNAKKATRSFHDTIGDAQTAARNWTLEPGSQGRQIRPTRNTLTHNNTRAVP